MTTDLQSNDAPHRIGIDLGGTKIQGVALDATGEIVARERVATETDGGYDHVCRNIKTVYEALVEAIDAASHTLGMGAPGATGPDDVHRTANPACANERHWQDDLAALLGHAIVIHNDAACFTAAEALAGAGRGHDLVFGATLGTGVGGGVTYKGEVIVGRQARAGEWGHATVERDGPACMCGTPGHAQAFVGGVAAEQRYLEETGKEKQFVEIERSDEERDVAFMNRFIADLGLGLSNVVAMIDPDIIVLGGGVSKMPGLADRTREAIAPHLVPHATPPPVVLSELGGDAGAIGAAMVGV